MLGVAGKPDVSPARAPSSLLRWVPVVLDHGPPALNVVSDMANLPYVVLERMGKWIFPRKTPKHGIGRAILCIHLSSWRKPGGRTTGKYKGHSRHGDVCNEEAIRATPKVKSASGPQTCVNYQIEELLPAAKSWKTALGRCSPFSKNGRRYILGFNDLCVDNG